MGNDILNPVSVSGEKICDDPDVCKIQVPLGAISVPDVCNIGASCVKSELRIICEHVYAFVACLFSV